ncbi:enoyl-CoA hydratase-related protein [Nocardioides litoris]|uniref:enoyl-CoA hydratase-related protein n=1 Tax=Nocardioides litoris TaxID=1926648 RepID=UPI0011244F5F|nr:enoyl-CoA hydratase-related protein [Nocardioides litoris]
MSPLDPRTPVLVGVGQHSERIDDASYEALSHVDLAARAARAALADTGLDPETWVGEVDVVAATRQFESATPLNEVPFGRSSNVPRSIAQRLAADPARAVLEVGGGQSPQHLVTEMAGEIAAGRAEVALLAGAEAMSTVRHLRGTDAQPDWTEDPGGSLEDRGYGLQGMVVRRALTHGPQEIAGFYAMGDHARRARLGLSRDAYAAAMGELFAPFTQVAAANPHAVAPEELTAAELVTVDERNRMITTPYPRLVVSRDLVNQGAALLLTSVATAERLGVDRSRWVFLHGHCDLREQDWYDRADLAAAPTQPDAVRAALAQAGTTLDDVRWLDLYSCFPHAVLQLLDGLGLAPDDPRGLTLTGGLPFFGGPGNNYSMHAIAEVVDRCRAEPGSVGLVSANGGMLSKVSVGVYATTPAPWREGDDAALQAAADARPSVPLEDHPADGWLSVETWTVRHGRSGRRAVVVGRTATGHRTTAASLPGDDELVDWLEADHQPVGQRVFVRDTGPAVRVALTRERMDELAPATGARTDWRGPWEHLRLDGLEAGVLEVEPAADLPAAGHHELASLLDAAEADPDVRVVLIRARFDLDGKPEHLPRSGWAGLTRRRLTVPVVLALGSPATGGGAEAVLAATFVTMGDDATLSFDHLAGGTLPEEGALVRLPRIVPQRVAAELVLTGRPVGAAEALALRLVNRAGADHLRQAREHAAHLAALPPHLVRATLAVLADAEAEPDTLAAVRRPRQVFDDVLVGE